MVPQIWAKMIHVSEALKSRLRLLFLFLSFSRYHSSLFFTPYLNSHTTSNSERRSILLFNGVFRSRPDIFSPLFQVSSLKLWVLSSEIKPSRNLYNHGFILLFDRGI